MCAYQPGVQTCALPIRSVQVARDEHHARAAILSRPFVERDRRIQHMLVAVNDQWFVQPLDIDDALDAQHVEALEGRKDADPSIERGILQWLLERQADRPDTIVVTVHVMTMVIVVMMSVGMVMSMVVAVMARVIMSLRDRKSVV